MTNPFAGPMAYPWKRSEAQALYAILIRDIRQIAEIERLFKAAGGDAAYLNTNQAANQVWTGALDLLAPAGFILDLCRQLLADHSDLPDVVAAAQAMLDAQPAVQKRIASDGRITVDRAPLRNLLSDLSLEEPPFKVVLVRGEPQSGKTWSRYLFERAAKDRGAEVVFLDRATVGTVHEVVRKLFAVFGATDQIPAVHDSTGPAWYRAVCNELAGVATKREPPRQLWIAADDLGFHPDGKISLMDPEIRDFFDQFVLHLLDPQTYKWFRLMLIHYPDAEPSTWIKDGLWEQDLVPGARLCKDDVAEVIREWRQDRGKTMLDETVNSLASSVIAFADSPPAGNSKPWLALMYEALKRELDKMDRP